MTKCEYAPCNTDCAFWETCVKKTRREDAMAKSALYIAVTADEYELPIFCDGTAAGLAQMLQIPASSIYSAFSRGGTTGTRSGYKVLRVDGT